MRHLLLGAVLLTFLPLTGGCARRASGPSTVRLVRSVSAVIRSETVTRLDVLSFPKEIRTVAALTPDDLEVSWFYRITVRRFARSKLKRELVSALQTSAINTRPQRDADYRWACIFYKDDGTRAVAMYFDGFGTVGLIAGTPVTLNGRFVRLLERRFSCAWK